VVDVAVEAADGVPAEALGLPGQSTQRGVRGAVREKRLCVFHCRLAPKLSVGGWRGHGDVQGRGRTGMRGSGICLSTTRRARAKPLLFTVFFLDLIAWAVPICAAQAFRPGPSGHLFIYPPEISESIRYFSRYGAVIVTQHVISATLL
jgi:hypothetical protein